MKRFLGLLLLVPSLALAGDYCKNETTGQCYPNILGGCPAGSVQVDYCPPVTPTPVVEPTVVPTPVPTPTPEPGILDKIKINLSQTLVLKLLGFFTLMVTVIQAAKKVLEKLKDWEWLIKMVPQLGIIINFFAHGIGPIILNVLLTLAVSAGPVLTDGVVTLREIVTLIGLVFGSDLFYRALRGGVFTKGDAT